MLATGRSGRPGSRSATVTLVGAETLLRQAIDRFGGLTADIEHTGYPIGHPEHRVKSVQLGDEAVVVFDAANPEHRDLIRALLTTAPKVYTYSAPADLNPLIHAGLTDDTLWDRVRDTLIVTRLADPATTGGRAGLKSVSPVVLGSAAVTPRADAARAELFAAGGRHGDLGDRAGDGGSAQHGEDGADNWRAAAVSACAAGVAGRSGYVDAVGGF